MNKRYQVFISSTFSDLEKERQELWQNLISFDYIVAGMEVFPAANEEQLSFIKKQISSSDFYVLIIAGRYGSITDEGQSFTEKEFEFALEQNIPILVFPIKDPRSVASSKTDEDSDKSRKLAVFRERACEKRVVKFWSSGTELSLAVIQALQTAMASSPRPGWVRGSTTASEELKDRYIKLQAEFDDLKAKHSKLLANETDFDPKTLSSWTELYFYSKALDERKVRITVAEILNQLSIMEQFDSNTLEEAVKGAISRKTGSDFEDISLAEWQLDRAIVLLARLEIARIDDSRARVRVCRGKNFLPANMYIKSKGWLNKEPVDG
ncbi:DUF4062 domain-containing protein [Methylocystis sp. JR02]|uniref:DUF4062 domain-containing protein n=1 Tax=Methylocystis sp. JR02 TaxID=3046284 RepID=UPI0024BB2CD6|nr:DUF4062 domain-containing protein [Methylocystis sp. JR02]MDJ0449375.1 DUF4062 domain-containing protein [Methylocystis sp. JR02]